MIGGMSWESSLEYYRIINEKVKNELGGLHSAKSILYSVDFDEIERLQRRGDWSSLTRMMSDAAVSLEKAGAGLIMICTNTMHLMAEEVQNSITVPLLHIADAAGEAASRLSLRKLGLLGTKFTMEKDFYSGRLSRNFGLEVIIPSEDDRQTVHDVIYNELCLGNINDGSRTRFLEIIGRLIDDGAEGIVLGCTEIPLLVRQADVSVPVLDTTRIHAEAAVTEALKDEQ